MCSVKKMAKAGGLLLFAAGMLLAIACKTPTDGRDSGGDNPPDKTSLTDKITEAQALLDQLEALAESLDGTDIYTTSYWISSGDKWKLTVAIEDAQTIADSPNATAEEIQLALEALAEACNAANAAKKPGTKTVPEPEPVNKSALGAKMVEAEAFAEALQVAANGDNIPPNQDWVTDAEKAALLAAIAAAQAVAIDEDAAQDAVDSALAALTAACNEANSAKKKGTTPDKTALNAKIIEAEQAKANVGWSESEDGSEYKPDQLWVTPAVYDALQAALSAAEQARDNAYATKAAVEAALASLTAALSAFDPQPGISVADKTELNALIREVEEILASVQASDNNGLDVYDTLQWVTTAEKEALETALHEAQAIAGDHLAEQAEVDDIKDALQEIFDLFSPQPGKMAVGHLDFYVTFNLPGDEAITLGADETLSWVHNDPLTIIVTDVTETFVSYQWRVDGIIRGETGNTIALFARDFSVGTHTVTLKVTTAGGVPYTKTLIFTVE